MAGGEAAFRTMFVVEAEKLDTDPHIPPDVLISVWAEIDQWDGVADLQAHAVQCLAKHPFEGPPVGLGTDEELGTTQGTASLTRSLSMQAAAGLPALTQVEVGSYLQQVESEPDPSNALDRFRHWFSGLRLRPVPADKKQARLFAFRDSLSPSSPLIDRDFEDILEKLAIPSATASDWLMMAYRPDPDDLVHAPNCLDANMWNLGEFIPGGLTKGGVEEVITTPPRCAAITMPPRRVAP